MNQGDEEVVREVKAFLTRSDKVLDGMIAQLDNISAALQAIIDKLKETHAEEAAKPGQE